MNMFENNGFIQSNLSETDFNFDSDFKFDIKSNDKMPSHYTFDIVMNNIKNQGYTYKCVAYTLSYILELQNQLDGKKIRMDIDDLYSKRENPKENGMSIKNALSIIKHDGYKHDQGISHINYYARVGSIPAMKAGLIANGPFIMALPSCDVQDDIFWKGGPVVGGHAIACVGYNEEGFILLNSYGSSCGNNGKLILPYDDLKYVLEAWTVIL